MTALESYLKTSYEPEMEFVDGKVVHRCVGEAVHSFTQGLIAAELGHRERLGFRTFLAPRVRVNDKPCIRVPDVCVMALPHEVAPVLTSPHLVVEVLCPEDSARALLTKV